MKRNVGTGKKIAIAVLTVSLTALLAIICVYVVMLLRTPSDKTAENQEEEEGSTQAELLFPEETQEGEQSSETQTEEETPLSDEEILAYGKMKFMGMGAQQDYDVAARCFYTVARDSGEAAYALGLMYVYGMGVPINHERAMQYLEHASELGNEDAAGCISKLSASSQANDALPYRLTSVSAYEEEVDEGLAKVASSNFEGELARLAAGDFVTAPSMTIFGKEDWLFNQCRTDGDAFADYIADEDSYFTQEELSQIGARLKKEEELLSQKGSDFYVMIIPNKETIYDEFMPAYMKENKENEETRTDRLVKYLEGEGIQVIYMKDAYRDYKEQYQIYYKTDTHANMIGSFVALEALIHELDPDNGIDVEQITFAEHYHDYCGDLGSRFEDTKRYSVDTVYFLTEDAVPEEDRLDKSLLLIGDSFGEFINIEAGYYFKDGMTFGLVLDYDIDYGKATDSLLGSAAPDVVVWELTERYADRLK